MNYLNLRAVNIRLKNIPNLIWPLAGLGIAICLWVFLPIAKTMYPKKSWKALLHKLGGYLQRV